VDTCRNHGFTDVVILHEHRGQPGEAQHALRHSGYSRQTAHTHEAHVHTVAG
jgi:hypothetical protein